MILRVLDLFSGIGGFSLGLERTGGFKTFAFCEIEEYPRKVIAKHWPDVPCFRDVRELKGIDIGTVDVICGGFPCQDLRSAGSSLGIGEVTRIGLFREMLRIASECGNPIIIFENVSRILSGPTENPGEWFYEFLNSLAEIGYDAEWFCVTAASVGAPHYRDRLWVVAYPHKTQLERGGVSKRVFEEHANIIGTSWWEIEPPVGRVANGVPQQSHRLGCLGNSVVPVIPEIIGRAILGAMK